MKKEKLIEMLQALPNNTEVCIVDHRKNIHYADDEPQGNGIMPNFNVHYEDQDVTIPFIALFFENDDYKDDGTYSDDLIYSVSKIPE